MNFRSFVIYDFRNDLLNFTEKDLHFLQVYYRHAYNRTFNTYVLPNLSIKHDALESLSLYKKLISLGKK